MAPFLRKHQQTGTETGDALRCDVMRCVGGNGIKDLRDWEGVLGKKDKAALAVWDYYQGGQR